MEVHDHVGMQTRNFLHRDGRVKRNRARNIRRTARISASREELVLTKAMALFVDTLPLASRNFV